MSKLFIPIIFGTGHEHRILYTENAASAVLAQAKNYGFLTELIDARTAVTPQTCRDCKDEKHEKMSAALARADGFIWISPEYNHGYPGELKMMLDSFYDEWNRKPVGIVGVSSGGIGGARMVEQLRLVAIALQLVPTNAVVHFSNVKTLMDEKGLKPEQVPLYKERFAKLFDELSWYANALKAARK